MSNLRLSLRGIKIHWLKLMHTGTVCTLADNETDQILERHYIHTFHFFHVCLIQYYTQKYMLEKSRRAAMYYTRGNVPHQITYEGLRTVE